MTPLKPTILVLMGGYWPGHESTGPNQSLVGLCKALGGEFSFKIVARDRAFGGSAPLAPSGRWIELGFAQVQYCKVTMSGSEGLAKILRTTRHDVLAMNGFFDREFTIPAVLLRRLGCIPRNPAVLSTRGEMASGALSLKTPRKTAYRAIARYAGLLRDVWLHGTERHEVEDIRARFPWSRGILMAPNVRTLVDVPAMVREQRNVGSRCRLVFVGRIARVKNLAFALDVLRRVVAPIDFDIYGPIDEPDYWMECARIIGELPENIRVTHKGEIANVKLPTEIGSASGMFLPSLGENFGHAIFEALSCGVPVIISNKTPWRGLEKDDAGWSLPLENAEEFIAAIHTLAQMKPEQHARLRIGARTRAERWVAQSDAIEQNRQLFATVLSEPIANSRLPGGRTSRELVE
jgi:hypothetical protein